MARFDRDSRDRNNRDRDNFGKGGFDKERALQGLSALAHERRIDVFRLLVRAGPPGLPAGEIAGRLGIPANTLSSQLAILARAGLIKGDRQGRSIVYSLSPDGIRGLLGWLMEDCCGGDPSICAPDALTKGACGP